MAVVVSASSIHRFHWDEPRWIGDTGDVAHHGVDITAAGAVVTQLPDRSGIVVLDPEGTTVRSWPMAATQAHGITVDGDAVWLVDNGAARVLAPDGSYRKQAPHQPVQGSVAKYTTGGVELLRLAPPPLDAGRDYSPTQVVVTDAGELWVADGHGSHLVHRYDEHGRYRSTIDGTDGAGRFDHPHGVLIDRRGRLLVADRNHGRLQAFDLAGRFLASIGDDFLVSPSSMAIWGDDIIVAEHDARLTIVDSNDRLVGHLGAGDQRRWVRPTSPDAGPVPPGRFAAPHTVAVDGAGTIHVTEYGVGGRYVRLVHE